MLIVISRTYTFLTEILVRKEQIQYSYKREEKRREENFFIYHLIQNTNKAVERCYIFIHWLQPLFYANTV